MFISKVLIHLCVIIHYIVKGNVFVFRSKEEILRSHVKFMVKKTFKNYERKINSPFLNYSDLESMLLPEYNGKQKMDETYTRKYQKHASCCYNYKLVCVDVKFSKPFKSYFNEYDVCNFINSITEESKYCSDAMEKHFSKEPVINKKDDGEFEKS